MKVKKRSQEVNDKMLQLAVASDGVKCLYSMSLTKVEVMPAASGSATRKSPPVEQITLASVKQDRRDQAELTLVVVEPVRS